MMVGVKVWVAVPVWVAVGGWNSKVSVGEVMGRGVPERSIVAVGVLSVCSRLAFHNARDPRQ